MEKIAYVFAGQGSQFVGMGADFSKDPLFQQLSAHWQVPVRELFAETPYWEQHPMALPSMLATISLVIAAHVETILAPDIVAGLSLGEYSALTYAKAMDPKVMWTILDQRTKWMTDLGNQNPTALLVVLGLTRDQVETSIAAFHNVYIANHNAPEQIVIGGTLADIEHVKESLMLAGARRCIPLPVVAASHTPFMQPMVESMKHLFERSATTSPEIPVVSNVTALPHEPQTWKQTLSHQLSTTVEWVRSVEWMVQQGVTTFIEIGPGTVLSGLIQKIQPQVKTYSVNSMDDLSFIQDIKDKGGFQ